MKKLFLTSICLGLSFVTSACMTSRLQMREREETHDTSKPVPAKVEEVAPQGGYVIDEIKNELTRLTGKVDDLERAQAELISSKAKTDKSDEMKQLEERVIELEKTQADLIEELKKHQSAKAQADGPAMFQKGKAEYEAGKYDAAIETLTAYLKLPKGNMIESATFLRAECYFKTKQYKRAIVDYSAFPEKFKRSKYMPPALLNIGLSFEALGMKEDAKPFFQELVANFPKTAEAKKARAKVK